MDVVSTGATRLARGVRRPGPLALAPGVERYVVPGRSARTIRLAGGDVIRLVNSEGVQPCELVCMADSPVFADSGGAAGEIRRIASAPMARHTAWTTSTAESPIRSI